MTFERSRGRTRGRRTRGQALVEFAIVLPIFLLLLMALIDFGRVIYAQHTIAQDAREAVRRGVVSTAGLDSNAKFTQRFADIRTAARVMAPAVPITDASIFGAPGACSAVGGMPNDSVMPANVTVANSCFYPNGIVNADPLTPPKVVVRIQVRVDFVTPIISNIVGGGITISAQSEQLIQS